MTLDSPWLLPASGMLCGIILGAVARYYRFCTLSALERHWYAQDSVGLRSWVFAATVALASTQLLILFDLIRVQDSFYLTARFSVAGSVIGGILFGVGMALVGTCGFGALVRVGGGSLQSLVVVITIGLAALSAQRGVLGIARERLVEPLAIQFSSISSQSLPTMLSEWLNLPLYWPVVLLCIGLLIFWLFKDNNFRRSRRGMASGLLIGACITLGWFITYRFGQYLYQPVQLESASFVLPQGLLVQAMISTASPLPDYGVGLIPGVVFGALLVALVQRDIRWEACDDARELRRHLGGAVLMGIGGVLAAGCTIGQGVSAFSLLTVSAPVVFLSMCLGARIGLSWLLEGAPFGWLTQ